MKRYRFPLRSVATLRGWHEGQAREAFALKLRELRDAETAVLAAREKVQETERQLREGRAARFHPAEQVAFLAAYQDQQAAVQQAIHVRDQARVAADGAREVWQGRRNDLRAVQQLETRARQAHRRETEREEQGLLDELATLRATRSSPTLT